jgi:hypothetical protein
LYKLWCILTYKIFFSVGFLGSVAGIDFGFRWTKYHIRMRLLSILWTYPYRLSWPSSRALCEIKLEKAILRILLFPLIEICSRYNLLKNVRGVMVPSRCHTPEMIALQTDLLQRALLTLVWRLIHGCRNFFQRYLIIWTEMAKGRSVWERCVIPLARFISYLVAHYTFRNWLQY